MGKKQTHNYLDVSVPVSSRLPVWPGDPGIDIAFTKRPEEGNPVTASRLNLGSHSGTHIDAPAHFIPGGSTIDTIALDRLIGPCRVIDLTDAETIGVDELIAADWSADTGRLLLKTRNSSHWEDGTFYQGYCALEPSAAALLVERGVDVIGIDYLSIGLPASGQETHEILLRAGMIVLEGLDLRSALPGDYELICLPLKTVGTEGAPVRAVLKPLPHYS